MSNTRLQKIIDEYKESIIQSEAEVRSKLIVPLLEVLGYPSYLRSEEFPVYGFEGGKPLPAKNADFALFSDKNFAKHRKFTQKDIDWVYAHSLLIVEAKKPGKMPPVLGQPVFYTIWTRAVAYLFIDGISIKGYYYNSVNLDYQIIDSKIEDLPSCKEIWELSFDRVLGTKESSKTIQSSPTLQNNLTQIVIKEGYPSDARLADANTINTVTEDDVKNFPEHSLNYMRYALGRNAEGLSNLQLISRFLNTTDYLLQNDMRYDVPQYIIDMPRGTHSAHLYIDNIIFPIEIGEITTFYWNDDEKYIFESKYIQIQIIKHKERITNFEIGFRVLDKNVSERLISFQKVKRILSSNTIRITISDFPEKEFILPAGKPKKMWASKEERLTMCDYWKDGLEQMKIIEDFYDIKFELEPVTGHENVTRLYDAVSYVYDGIVLNQNCEIKLPGDYFDDDVIVNEPILLEENKDIPLDAQRIHNITFAPYKSCILPCEIPMKGTTSADIIRVPGCVAYKVVEINK